MDYADGRSIEVGCVTQASAQCLSLPSRASRVTVGCEAEGKAQEPLSCPGVTGKGKGGWVNESEPLMRLRYSELWKTGEGPECRAGRGGAATALMRFRRLCEHRSPGVKGAPEPTRISFVRNMETPSRSQHAPSVVQGRPIARKAQSPGRDRKAQEANAGSRKATGNRDGRPCLPRLSRITGRIQANAWHESELTWAW